MMCKWFIPHKWQNIYSEYTEMFLGKPCEKRHLRFRICSKCESVQERYLVGYAGCKWVYLDDCKSKIVSLKL